jgi:hypothetical protein
MSEALRMVCAWCGRVRTRTGEWRRNDKGDARADAPSSHGICAECLERTTPEAATPLPTRLIPDGAQPRP